MDNDTYDDRTNIKFLKQNEINELQVTINSNIVKRLEELEDFKDKALIRLDQEIENRTKAFEKIEALEEDFDMTKRYTLDGLRDSLRELQYNIDTKLERIDDILVVHSNQSDSQRKNHFQLQKVFSDKVMELLEGKHGKQE